ncbi:PREDICTED: sulfotransferase 4A1-like [Myotis davidii]|uniref:sulfotransferase 4A1-like n=1 Tax=Myotis davidii TaxID=225400 RepID=UPI000767BAB5|nr:PREDICTED: sulfotransferase 4A1-like [Myotis davidii]
MNIDEQLPVLEYPQPGLDIIKELTSPRLIKSHLPYRFLPSDLHNGDSKVMPCPSRWPVPSRPPRPREVRPWCQRPPWQSQCL